MKNLIIFIFILCPFISCEDDKEIKQIEITLETEGNGTVIGSGKYNYGTSAIIKAHAKKPDVFVGWSKDNNVIWNDTILELKLEQDITLNAKFLSVDQTYKVTIYNAPNTTLYYVEKGNSINLSCDKYRPNSSSSFGYWQEYTTEGKILSRNCDFKYTPTKDITIYPYYQYY